MYFNKSFLPLCFVSFFPYATTYLPALLSCFLSLFRFVSPFPFLLPSLLVLVAILYYIPTYTSVPILVLPRQDTTHGDTFVTLYCITYHLRNNYNTQQYVSSTNKVLNCLPNYHQSTSTYNPSTTNLPTHMACTAIPPPCKPNTTCT